MSRGMQLMYKYYLVASLYIVFELPAYHQVFMDSVRLYRVFLFFLFFIFLGEDMPSISFLGNAMKALKKSKFLLWS
jgi:hypothetical protein